MSCSPRLMYATHAFPPPRASRRPCACALWSLLDVPIKGGRVAVLESHEKSLFDHSVLVRRRVELLLRAKQIYSSLEVVVDATVEFRQRQARRVLDPQTSVCTRRTGEGVAATALRRPWGRVHLLGFDFCIAD